MKIISTLIGITTLLICIIIYIRLSEPIDDFVFSYFGVIESTKTIFVGGMVLCGIVKIYAIFRSQKNNYWEIIPSLGLITLALFNLESFFLIHWIGALVLFTGYPVLYIFASNTKDSKQTRLILGLLNLFLNILVWGQSKLIAEIIGIIFIVYYQFRISKW